MNLTEGKPLTDGIRSCPSFCGENGCFNAKFHLSKIEQRFLLTAKERRAVSVELQAQIQKYLSFNLPLMHADGHHHAHVDYSIMPILLPLLYGASFRSMRIRGNLFLMEQRALSERIMLPVQRYLLKRYPMKTVQFFGDIKGYTRYRDKLPQDGTFEIMVHPRYQDNGTVGDAEGTFNQFPEIVDSLAKHGDRLISYNEILP